MTRKRKEIVKADQYEPTSRERATVEAYFARQKEAPPAPRMKVTKKGGVPTLAADHPDPAIG